MYDSLLLKFSNCVDDFVSKAVSYKRMLMLYALEMFPFEGEEFKGY